MKKIILFLLAALTLTLCACGGSPFLPDGLLPDGLLPDGVSVKDVLGGKSAADKNPYLTFQGDGAFSMEIEYEPIWDGVMEYSTDAEAWTEWDGGEVSAAETKDGYVLFFRGTGNSRVSAESSDNHSSWNIACESEETKVACSGNIEMLLDYATVEAGEHPEMAAYCYADMFGGCTNLTTAPELPATELAAFCYDGMFGGCTNLTTAPELPATKLAYSCYACMFAYCKSLTTLPELPATETAYGCYAGMFADCSGIQLSEIGEGEGWSIPADVICGDIPEGVPDYDPHCGDVRSNGMFCSYVVHGGGAYPPMFSGPDSNFTGNPVPGVTYYYMR